MSRKKYPFLDSCRPIKKNMKCQAKDCKNEAEWRIEIQVSYMRGDDEVYYTCQRHSHFAKHGLWKEFFNEMPEHD